MWFVRSGCCVLQLTCAMDNMTEMMAQRPAMALAPVVENQNVIVVIGCFSSM